jgi:predicted XRE-type DNA-binding protein
MKAKSKKKNYVVAKNPAELAKALGLEPEVDAQLMEAKVRLSEMATKAITRSGLAVNEIVKRSGVARSKVSAIKNGALAGISSDLFLKVIMASGSKVNFKLTG